MRDILVIGISAVDIIGGGIDSYPPPGGVRFFDSLTLASGGCGVNVAIALGRLGVGCDLVTRVGTDRLGDFLVDELEGHGIDCSQVVRDPEEATPFTFVTLDHGGQRSFFHYRGTNDGLQPDDIDDGLLERRRWVMISGSLLMDRLDGAPTVELLKNARRAGARTLLDTVYVDALPTERWQELLVPCLPHLDLFAPSLPEAQRLTGCEEPDQVAARLREFGATGMVIKLDARGALVVEGDRSFLVPAFPVDEVVDSTGAGDCFCAGLLAGLHLDLTLEHAARMGNAVAAHCIVAQGATAGVRSLAATQSFLGNN